MPSAKAEVCITNILYEIIESEMFRYDYEGTTKGLLFVPETYETVIKSIKRLADSGMWD